MKTIMLLIAVCVFSGCTVATHVKDIRTVNRVDEPIRLEQQKCELKVYLAIYGLISSDSDCKWERVL
jgi:uncharacterized protein YceK